MARKKKPADNALVAATGIAIEGQHFDAGAEVTGVSDEELRKVVQSRRVVPFSEFAGKAKPEPEPEAEPEPESSTDAPDAA